MNNILYHVDNMAENKKNKQKKKMQLGRLESSLVEDLDKYSKLKGTNRTAMLRNLIKKELKGKILSSDGVLFSKSFYFNMEALLKDLHVEALTENPLSDSEIMSSEVGEKYIKINGIPNNLDSWNDEYDTFCSGYGVHKGIKSFIIEYPVLNPESGHTQYNIGLIHLFFKYEFKGGFIYASEKEVTLNINLIPWKNLYLLLKKHNEKQTDQLLQEIADLKAEIELAFKTHDDYENLFNYFNNLNGPFLSTLYDENITELVASLIEKSPNLNEYDLYDFISPI